MWCPHWQSQCITVKAGNLTCYCRTETVWLIPEYFRCKLWTVNRILTRQWKKTTFYRAKWWLRYEHLWRCDEETNYELRSWMINCDPWTWLERSWWVSNVMLHALSTSTVISGQLDEDTLFVMSHYLAQFGVLRPVNQTGYIRAAGWTHAVCNVARYNHERT